MSPVHQVALEVQLAQGLAGNEPGNRDKTFQTLRKFVRLQLPYLKESLTQDDFTKIWKGIHYRLWMQDKPLLQENLVNEVCGLLFHFPTEEYAMMYIKTFFETETREWGGIDQHRLDKFMMLIREFINSVFVFLSKSGWKVDLIKQLNVIMEESIFNPGKAMQPISLQLHLIDVYSLELRKVLDEQLTPDTATHLFTAFVNIFPVLNNPAVVASVLKLLHKIVFDDECPEDKKDRKRYVLNGCEERNATDFENPLKLTIDREKFLTILMDKAGSEKGTSKRRKQLYNLIKRIKDSEYAKSSSKSANSSKSVKKKSKCKKDNIKPINVEEAAQRYLDFNKKLCKEIPSTKHYKKLERLRLKKKQDQEKCNGDKKKKDKGRMADEEEDEDSVAEGVEEEEDEEYVESTDEEDSESTDEEEEEDSEGTDDAEEEDIESAEEEEDGESMEDDSEDVGCEFIQFEADEVDDEDYDFDTEEEEEEGTSDEEFDAEASLGRGKRRMTRSDKIDSVYVNREPDESDDNDYDDGNEESGSDDGLEFDAEEAFLKMEEGETEEESSIEGNEEGADDVDCYIVDVHTDNNNSSSGSDKVQNIQQQQLEAQAGPTWKPKKDSGSSGDGKTALRKCKRKKIELELDEEEMIGKKMKMMVEMMTSKKVTKGKKKKKKQAKAVPDCKSPSITDTPQLTSGWFAMVDFERDDEKKEEVSGLINQTATKEKVQNKQTENESIANKKNKKRKKQQQNENSQETFPLPTGLKTSLNNQVVYDQLKDTVNTKQMRQTVVADKKIKHKLNRYFDMVAKSKLLNEASSTANNNQDNKTESALLSDNEGKKNKKNRNNTKVKNAKPQLTENLKNFCESPPVFFQNAVSKVKMSAKRKKNKPKITLTEDVNDTSLLDRKSVSFDMNQNKAFLPETPISSEKPFISQKKPKTGILKPSPSPILVRKKKKKATKRAKAADFF